MCLRKEKALEVKTELYLIVPFILTHSAIISFYF
uniref:Uncharacterized protein n=1 Tax=Anguilla anguilla TaxID=7936 RepID=A0A0E9UBJ5_ANGAN